MAFHARRDTTCSKCGLDIKTGQEIKWQRHTGKTWHSACDALPQCPNENKPTANDTPDGVNVPVLSGTAPDAQNEAVNAEIIETEGTLSGNGNSASNEPYNALDKALAEYVKAHAPELAKLDEKRVREIASEVARAVSTKTLKIKTDAHDETVDLGLSHRDLPILLKLIGTRGANGHRLNVYMYGPAGSGKSTAAKQASEAFKLGWGYSSLNPQTPDSRLLGYMHAGGEYVPSEFFKRYTEGGIFCLDEIDNAAASLVTTLNSMLENGHGAFPHGVFPRHEDFVCVCTANTIGRGGDIHYPERRMLDGAFLERFVFLEWGYDTSLTNAIVSGILGPEKCEEFITWVKLESDKLKARFPNLIISPRAYIQGATLEKTGMNRKQIVEMAISRGVDNGN